jgi:Mg/Co/Ni transporter MgtE
MEKLIVPEIIEALEKGDRKYIRNVFENLHPGDASDILENLSSDEIIMIIKILPENTIFPIMEEVEPEKFTDILNLLEDEWLAEVLDAIPPDDGVDILQLLPDERASEIIDLMNRFESQKVKQLLPYPENTAGAVMTTEVTTLPATITVGKAIEFLRKLSARRETILYIYIVD